MMRPGADAGAGVGAVARLDAVNVLGLLLVSPPHGVAAAAGFLPAAVATMLVSRGRIGSRAARALFVVGLVPNTLGAIAAARRSRALSLYLGVGGAAIGVGYLLALRSDPGS